MRSRLSEMIRAKQIKKTKADPDFIKNDPYRNGTGLLYICLELSAAASAAVVVAAAAAAVVAAAAAEDHEKNDDP